MSHISQYFCDVCKKECEWDSDEDFYNNLKFSSVNDEKRYYFYKAASAFRIIHYHQECFDNLYFSFEKLLEEIKP